MRNAPDDAVRRRLLRLLEPLHDHARLTARRLSRSNADGDDLFQETVVQALARFSSLRDEHRFRPWFFAILLSLHRRKHRASVWRRWLPMVEEPRAPDGPDTETTRRLRRALLLLTAAEREALILFELQGFQLDEIATLQASSVPAVKSRLARARARMRQHYARMSQQLSCLMTEKMP